MKRIALIILFSVLFFVCCLNWVQAENMNLPQPYTMPYNNGNGCYNNTCGNQSIQTPPLNTPYNNNIPFDGQVNAPHNLLIILDASYSMDEKIGNARKIDMAKRVIYKTLQEIPPNTRVGFRVYGHKTGFMAFNVCNKSELIVPIGFNTQNAILSRLAKIQPTGATPIAFSLESSVRNDFNGLDGAKNIILVSDGMETCGGDPCRYAVELVRQGIDMKIDVVGFDLRDQASVNQLKCISLSTNGKFYTSNDEDSLARSLKDAVQYKKSVSGFIIPRR